MFAGQKTRRPRYIPGHSVPPPSLTGASAPTSSAHNQQVRPFLSPPRMVGFLAMRT
jgi:hypothetical protein